jgi:succinylglutamate desuccinylase
MTWWGSLSMLTDKQKNEHWLNEEQREQVKQIKESLESSVDTVLRQVDFADPNALAYGIRRVSEDMQEMFWEQISEKYEDKISDFSLEQVIRKVGAEDIKDGAWIF